MNFPSLYTTKHIWKKFSTAANNFVDISHKCFYINKFFPLISVEKKWKRENAHKNIKLWIINFAPWGFFIYFFCAQCGKNYFPFSFIAVENF